MFNVPKDSVKIIGREDGVPSSNSGFAFTLALPPLDNA